MSLVDCCPIYWASHSIMKKKRKTKLSMLHRGREIVPDGGTNERKVLALDWNTKYAIISTGAERALWDVHPTRLTDI